MRAIVVWTAKLDGRLRALRLAGLTWEQVALEMELGRNTVVERARRIGVRARRRLKSPSFPEAQARPARPAGHPDTWGLITRNTVLTDEPYPYPVFL